MKTVLGAFFLSLFFAIPASAVETTLAVSSDYKVSQVATLGNATAFTFDSDENFIVAENTGNAFRVINVAPDGTTQALLERTSQNITNLSYYQGVVYIVSRGQIYKISKGKISDVISGLPSLGDYGNSGVVFADGFMYFAIGTATNSGIVGPDNSWLATYPSFHDKSCGSTKLSGVNVETDNFLTAKKGDKAITGSFMPFNTQATAGALAYGMYKCNGAVIQSTPDGKATQIYASGLHNPKGISIDDKGQLWVFDGGMEDRGIRPIKNGKDALFQISENSWYGWPDYNAGARVDQQAILADAPNPAEPKEVYDLGALKYLIASPAQFSSNFIGQISDEKLVEVAGTNFHDFLSVVNGKIIQYKFGPDNKFYVLVGLANGKSNLYAIESAKPYSGIGVARTKTKLPWDWIFASMLVVLTGGSYYVVRNLRYPINPL